MSEDQAKSFILFVANIPINTTQREVHDVFKRFGKIQSIHLSTNSKRIGTTFAFVQYDDMRDAYDACEALNNTIFKDKVLRIQYRIGGGTQTKRFQNDEQIPNPASRREKQQANIQSQVEGEFQGSNNSDNKQLDKNNGSSPERSYPKVEDKLIELQKKIYYLQQRVLRLQSKQTR